MSTDQLVLPSTQDRLCRRGCSQCGVVHPSTHLNELDRPLHVREAAGAKLHVASGLDAARQTLVLHAGFEQANVSHLQLTHSPIGELIEQCPCRIGEAPLTDRARTHRRLALPG